VIFLQSHNELRNLGQKQVKFCPFCKQNQNHSIWLQYRLTTFNLIMNFASDVKYHLACSNCRNGVRLKNQEIEKYFKEKFKTHPVPFSHRYGGIIVLIVLSLLVVAIFANKAYKFLPDW